MRIRAPRGDELALLQEIERAAGRAFGDIGMPEIADDDPPGIDVLDRCRRSGLALVSVDDSDMPVAYLIAERVDDALHIEQVSVHPDHSGEGRGRSLIDHLAVRASAEGAAVLTLTTFAAVPWNAPYYERCGFERIDDRLIGPGLRRIRSHEAEIGLDRWPRTCMRRTL